MIASIVVGAALLVAGGAKIAAGPAWPVQARGLGAPAAVIPFVPWIEIVVGALLCAQIARPIPAVLALVMLVVFSGLLALRLSRGQHPQCACFGSWSAKPLSWRHLARNSALITAAVIAIVAS
ncbi:MAG: MauE/DoxX family redox-associated membrane protein [Ilumatobacteraceae bacterium]